LLEAARGSQTFDRQKIDFIMSALCGTTQGFEKVIKFIDDMVARLNQEKLDDDHKKEYIEMQFGFIDKKKELAAPAPAMKASGWCQERFSVHSECRWKAFQSAWGCPGNVSERVY